LHSPLPTWNQTLEAWKALEEFVPDQIRTLGVSNSNLQVIKILCVSESVKVRPTVVQNRFCQEASFDTDVRTFCRGNNITYQAFWVLTANPQLLVSEPVKVIAKEAKIEVQIALYGLVSSLGNVSVLNGTTNYEHMVHDIASFTHLNVWKLVEENRAVWEKCLVEFKKLIGDEKA
jgi:diketogulonate reductase-like aldo/keto reductase